MRSVRILCFKRKIITLVVVMISSPVSYVITQVYVSFSVVQITGSES